MARAAVCAAALAALCGVHCVTAAESPSRPHVIFILADDLGYGIPGWGAAPTSPMQTPAIKALMDEGLTLTRQYAYMSCSPSRGSLLTGRYPYKLPQTRTNFLPATIPDVTPLSFAMLPEKLASAGYVSHHVGKWHLGLYAPEFTPKYRGFNTSYGFLTGGEDHFTQAGDVGSTCGPHRAKVHDIWETNATAPQYQGQYTGYRINDVAMELIESHASVYGADTPMFMYLALHNTHAPIQAEKRFTDLYPHVTDTLERTFYAMVSTVDETVGNVTRALKGTGMWNNSLVVWMTDNGSPIQVAGTNYPLRGGKGSQWEGGVRVPAVVSGGVLPQTRRGATTASMVHIVDYYATILELAGVQPGDASDVPIDSLNVWPMLSGVEPTTPRDDGLTVLDHNMYAANNISTGALRLGRYKLIVGGGLGDGKHGQADPVGEWLASWYGEFSPNASFPGAYLYACAPKTPCVFDVEADPLEQHDLSAENPSLLAALMKEFNSLDGTYHPPRYGPQDEREAMCIAAEAAASETSSSLLFITPWRSP